jgi:hypothetical protein
MNLRTLAIVAASAAFGLSLAGSALASTDRPEPRETQSFDQSHPDRVDDKGDKSDSADKSSQDSHDSQDSKDPVEHSDTNSGR